MCALSVLMYVCGCVLCLCVSACACACVSLCACANLCVFSTFSTTNRIAVNVLAKANEEFNNSQFNSIVLVDFVYCTWIFRTWTWTNSAQTLTWTLSVHFIYQ